MGTSSFISCVYVAMSEGGTRCLPSDLVSLGRNGARRTLPFPSPPSLLPVHPTFPLRLERAGERLVLLEGVFQDMARAWEALAHQAPLRSYITRFAKLCAMFEAEDFFFFFLLTCNVSSDISVYI